MLVTTFSKVCFTNKINLKITSKDITTLLCISSWNKLFMVMILLLLALELIVGHAVKVAGEQGGQMGRNDRDILLAELSRKCHNLNLFVTLGFSKMPVHSNCHPRQGSTICRMWVPPHLCQQAECDFLYFIFLTHAAQFCTCGVHSVGQGGRLRPWKNSCFSQECWKGIWE